MESTLQHRKEKHANACNVHGLLNVIKHALWEGYKTLDIYKKILEESLRKPY